MSVEAVPETLQARTRVVENGTPEGATTVPVRRGHRKVAENKPASDYAVTGRELTVRVVERGKRLGLIVGEGERENLVPTASTVFGAATVGFASR